MQTRFANFEHLYSGQFLTPESQAPNLEFDRARRVYPGKLILFPRFADRHSS